MDSLRGRRTVSTLSVRGGFDAAQAKARDKAKAKARRSDTIGHLGPEAVVAFVDGEMEPKFMHRVRIHLVHCAECRADVVGRHRRQVELANRAAGEDRLPSALRDGLGGDQDALRVQPVQDLAKALAFFADQILGRDRKPVDEQFVRIDTFPAHLFDLAHGDERSVQIGVEKA